MFLLKIVSQTFNSFIHIYLLSKLYTCLITLLISDCFFKGSSRWLSADAVSVKQNRRRLERRWKSTGEESDRLRYRNVCKVSNRLINESRNKDRCVRVKAAAGNSRRVWAECKDLLHSSAPTDLKTENECRLFSQVLATHFINKVQNIKTAICTALHGAEPDQLMSVTLHLSAQLCDLDPVAPAEVVSLLLSMSVRSSPLDLMPTSLLKNCSDVFQLSSHALPICRSRKVSFPQNLKLLR